MENDVMQAIIKLERDFCHLVEDVKEIKSEGIRNSEDIRALQDAHLMRKAEMKEIVTEVIGEFNKTKTAKMQAFAPYFTALIMSIGGIIVALLYIANNTAKG